MEIQQFVDRIARFSTQTVNNLLKLFACESQAL